MLRKLRPEQWLDGKGWLIALALFLFLSTSFGAQAKHNDRLVVTCAIEVSEVQEAIQNLIKGVPDRPENCVLIGGVVDMDDMLKKGAVLYTGPTVDWQGDQFWVLRSKRGLYLWVWRFDHAKKSSI